MQKLTTAPKELKMELRKKAKLTESLESVTLTDFASGYVPNNMIHEIL
jgi:hypothetical protein